MIITGEIGILPGTNTHWFMMRMTGGAFKNHDNEYDTVVWMPIAEAATRLTDPDQKRILRSVELRK